MVVAMKAGEVQSRQTLGTALMLGVTVIGSALLSGAAWNGVPSPIHLAFAGTVSPLYGLAVFLGSLLHSLLLGTVTEQAPLLAAMALLVLLRFIFEISPEAFGMNALFAGGSLAASAAFFALCGTLSSSLFFLYLCLSVVTGVSAYFGSVAILALRRHERIALTGSVGAAFAVTYLLLVASLCGVRLLWLNFGQLLAAFCILTAAKHWRISGGAVVGLLSVCGAVLYAAELGMSTLFFAVAGMLCGVFFSCTAPLLRLMFVLVSGIGLFFLGLPETSMMTLVSAAAGSLLFDRRYSAPLLQKFCIPSEAETNMQRLSSVRLDFLRDALRDVRRNAQQIAEGLTPNYTRSSLAEQASAAVCAKCRNRMQCWETNYETTNEAFRQMAEFPLRDAEELPAGLEQCCRKEKLRAAFRSLYRQVSMRQVLEKRLRETQSLLYTQMQVTEEILSSASRRMDICYSRDMTRRLCHMLEEAELPYRTAVAYHLPDGRLAVELYLSEKLSEASELCSQIGEVLGRRLSPAELEHAGDEYRVFFHECTRYSVRCYGANCSASEEEPSGDSSSFFEDGQGSAYLVLSDGMGRGKLASLDSRLAVANFKRLILSGLDWQTAVRMVNSILLTKSSEESFATLDIARINLQTREVTLIKSGAAPTLIRAGEQVLLYRAPSHPVGIFSDLQPYCKTLKLEPGGAVVLLSDGFRPELYPYLKKQLLLGCEPQGLAYMACSKAQLSAEEGQRDDVTVLIAELDYHV